MALIVLNSLDPRDRQLINLFAAHGQAIHESSEEKSENVKISVDHSSVWYYIGGAVTGTDDSLATGNADEDTRDCQGQPHNQTDGSDGAHLKSSESRPTRGSGPTGRLELTSMGGQTASALPVADPKSGNHPASWQAQVQKSGAPPLHINQTYLSLVVEDDPIVLERVSDTMAGFGHDSVMVNTIEEARLALRGNEFTYVVASITASFSAKAEERAWRNGEHFLKEVKRARPHLPVILMGHQPEEYTAGVVRYLDRFGVEDVVIKPYPGRHMEGERKLSRAIEIAVEKLEKARRSRTSGSEAASATEAFTSTSSSPKSKEPELRPFEKAEITFYPTRVKLVTEAGEVQIIGDTGVGHCRRILEILGKTKRGKFIRVGGEVIASQLRKELNCAEIDIGTITSCVKHIRGNIRTRTRKQLKLIVGLMDVLVRDEQGYHLNDERITVRIYDSEEIVWGDDDESSATLAAGQSAPEVATESVLAEPKTSTDGTSSDIEEFDGLNQRQSWIVGKAKQGWKLTREQIEKKFSISERTAKRDLGDLRKRGLLKYIRRPHPGHYQLKASD